MCPEESLEDTHCSVGIEHPDTFTLSIPPELTGVGVVERKDHRSFPGRRGNPVLDHFTGGDHVKVVIVEPLQIFAKMIGCAHEHIRLFGWISGYDVVFDDWNESEFVGLGRQQFSWGERGGDR
jgi:hypothetical protein